MGKDATNTLFAENQVVDQRLGSDISGQQFKDEPLKQAEQPAGGFHGDKFHEHSGEQLKDARSPELMKDASVGGFHGDKWKDASETEQFNGRRPSLSNSMGDQFPADQFQGIQKFETETILRPAQSAAVPAATTATFSAGTVAPQLDAGSHFQQDMQFRGQDSGVKGDIIKNDTREIKQEMLAELKSHAGHSDSIAPSEIIGGTTFHDGRLHDGMLHDGRTVTPQMAAAEAHHEDKLPLAERIIAGVHAGDPLAFGAGKSKKSRKSRKDKKKQGATFGADEHFKNDKDLIPHEHLKKEEPLLADANIAGGAILQKEENFRASEPIDQPSLKKEKDKKHKLKKEKHFEHDAHLNKNVNIVDDIQINRDAHISNAEFSKEFKDSQFKDSQFKDSQFKDSQFKDSQFKDSQFKDSQFKDSQFKDSQLEGSAMKRDLNRQDAFLVTEDHDKATLKDKVRSKKDKLKQKLGMKKEEQLSKGESHAIEGNAPTKGHEIATIKIPGIESGDRAAQDMVNHQAKAKKELNAELKEHAGHADHIAPSEIIGHGIGQMSLHENRAVDTQMMPRGSGAMADQITRDQVLAKSELNAEIKNHSGSFIPSEISGTQFQSKDFGSSEFQNKDLLKDNQFQSKDFGSSEFQNKDFLKEKDFGSSEFQNKDLLKDNQFQSKDFGSSEFQNKDLLKDNQFQSKDFQSIKGDRLADLGATTDDMNKDNILAKKDLNDEIKGLGQDHIMPSDISHKEGDFNQFQHEKLQGEKLAGFSGSNDALTNNNILAKKEVLAEIKEAGMGHKDTILPSELLGSNQSFQDKDKDFQSKDFQSKDFQGDQLHNFQSKEQDFENTAEFQNKQFEKNNEYLSDKPGALGAMFKDEVMREHIQAKKELNAEIKEVAIGHNDQLLPSEISGAAPGGVTVIHDGRESDNYELAKESIEASEAQPMSLTQKIASTVANTVANAAVAVKETLQNLH